MFSGCSLFPHNRMKYPSSAYFFAISCIFSTFGHVQSFNSIFLFSASLYISFGTPCALIIVVPFASSILLINFIPSFFSSSTTVLLCTISPKHYILPSLLSFNIFLLPSTALFTPQQNPAVFPTIISIFYIFLLYFLLI